MKRILILLCTATALVAVSACSSGKGNKQPVEESVSPQEELILEKEKFHFTPSLDPYIPQKESYNFYLTYKTAHPWWDAVALGIEDAVKQFEKKGYFNDVLVIDDYISVAKLRKFLERTKLFPVFLRQYFAVTTPRIQENDI